MTDLDSSARFTAGAAPPPVARGLLVALLLTLTVGVGLRCFRLDFQSLWTDEGMSVHFAGGSVAETLAFLERDYHPPVYFVALNLWMDAFGRGDAALRGLSVLGGALTLLALWLVGRRLGGPRLGWLAMVLGSVSLYQIYYSQEARPYALVGAFTTLGMAAYLAFRDRPGWLRGAGLVLANSLLLLTNYLGAFALLSQTLHFAWVERRSGRRRWLAWLWVQMATGALFLPWLPTFLQQLDAVRDGFWIGQPDAAAFGEMLLVLLVYRPAWFDLTTFLGVFAGVLVHYYGCFWWASRTDQINKPFAERNGPPPVPAVPWLLGFWFLGTLGTTYLLSQGSMQVFHRRSLMVAAPALCLILAFLCRGMARFRLEGLVLAVLVAVSLAGAPAYYTRTHKHDYRGAARWLHEAGFQPGDPVLFEPDFFKPGFDHYFKEDYRFLTGQHVQDRTLPRGPRLYCVTARNSPQVRRLLQALQAFGYRSVQREDFRSVSVYRMSGG